MSDPRHALVVLQDTRSPRSFRLLSLANLASRLDQHSARSFSQIRAANEDDVCRFTEAPEVGIGALAPCRPNSVGHDGAAKPKRLFDADRRIARRLMLDLGVKLGAKQDHDGGDPHPHHHADGGAE